MKYSFILTYKPTDSETTTTRTCFPLHGDDLAISIDRAEDEWYYTRNLEDKLVFERGDYDWIMGCEFDGTFTLDIKESHDNGATWFDYFTGTFSRASMEIDEDNHTATLNGISEGIPDLIKNGAKEEYDLMKLIPDSEAKEVQGQVPPALALVDECSEVSKPTKSDIFCNAALTAGGYNSETDLFWAENKNMADRSTANLCTIIAEAKVQSGIYEGMYAGVVAYGTGQKQWIDNVGREYTVYITSVGGVLNNSDNTKLLRFGLFHDNYTTNRNAYIRFYLDNMLVATKQITDMYMDNPYYSPMSYTIDYQGTEGFIKIQLHYIYASLLTQAIPIVNLLPRLNYLDTSSYYKGIRPFNNNDDGLVVFPSVRTVDQPNGHRLVPGTDEYGGTPQYFAPPNTTQNWIPLAEDNWNYASMWYKITPSVPNGLIDPAKYGHFAWTRCWTIGCCIKYLLNRITDGKVVFNESTDYSQFLYGNPNPVEGHEPFSWLVTQKSNVMRPAATGAARCPAKLDWFFELLRNAFNCYYWFEKRNDGRYDFRIEHVEYFRRGGAYSGQLADQLDLTRLKPYRNFLRNNIPAKRYADGTNKYTFDLEGMVEKYTYSWQGDGGGDDFKGNPMYFRAGWIEKGSSEDRQVDNIFADLGWLMLNSGTDTASSKNYDGLFIFGGYRTPSIPGSWTENSAPISQILLLAKQSTMMYVSLDIWLTAPEGQAITLQRHWYQPQESSATEATYTGTGSMQHISVLFESAFIIPNDLGINFGANYADVIIHRIHARSGNVFYVPNVRNLLRTDVVNYLQNGVLAWPWLQKEYLHYDIPAAKWTYLKDEYTDGQTIVWETDGTIKLVKKQTVGVVPVPDANTEQDIMGIMGIKTGLGIGIIDSAKINLSSRNAEMTIIYDINPQNN